jgi:chorismate mutase / prephenate dehydratase
MTTDNLQTIRQQIDDIDKQIQNLINERAKLAETVGKNKREQGEDKVFYRPEREAQILQAIITRNTGPLSDKQVVAIFRPILTACLSLQQPIKIAYLGPEGSYSQAAIFKHFGEETMTVPAPSIERIFREIEAENVTYGVVPIENSTTGVINVTLDALMISPLTICGEIIIPIHHHLLSKQTTMQTIEKIYAHEQAFMQCRHWLETHLTNAEQIAVASNSAAAVIAQQEQNSAAIASELCGQIYGLNSLVNNIEDKPQNKTRFLILGQQKVAPSGSDKTSLLFTTPHTPGFLLKLLTSFAEQGINISLIESRPYHSGNWSYLFFIDIEGHQDDLSVKKALDALASKSVMLNILGSYPKALT